MGTTQALNVYNNFPISYHVVDTLCLRLAMNRSEIWYYDSTTCYWDRKINNSFCLHLCHEITNLNVLAVAIY